MVEADVCDDGKHGLDDVCAVEPASQTDFYDCEVNLLLLEVLEGKGCGEFEERKAPFYGQCFYVFDKVNDALFAYLFAVDSNSFAEVNKMGTCVETDAIALSLQNGCKCVTDGAFAIRAAYMNGSIASMRMAEVLIESKRASESLFIRRCPHILKHRGRVE